MTRKIAALVPVFLLMALLATFLFADTWTQTLSTEFGTDSMTDTETENDAVRLALDPTIAVDNWWDTSWGYRRAITIDNQSGSALTDYQVKVENPIYNESELVGSLHFEEGAGSTAVDSSGNRVNAAITIGGGGSQSNVTQAWTNGASGKSNSGFSFDGTDDYATVTLQQSPYSHTVAFWAKDPGGTWTHYAEANGIQYVNGQPQKFTNKYYSRVGTTLEIGRSVLVPNDSELASYLKLWLDVSDPATVVKDTSNRVSTFYDKSGAGNTFSQSVQSRQPIWTANTLNGWPVLTFTAGSSQTMTTATNFTAPVTVFVVERLTGGANARMLSAGNGGANWLLGFWGGARAQAYFEGWVSPTGTPAANTTWYVYDCTIPGSGQNSTIYENGTSIAANQGGVYGPNGLSLSGHQASSEFSNGQTAEVILYNRVLSTTERQGIETYLNKKYGIAVATPAYSYFNGIMDEFRVYNRVLTVAEIKALANFKVKANYQDIRFTDSTGQELPYWMEKDGSFWVKVTGASSIPTGLSRIYMYYGNPSASFGGSFANSPANTLEFYDDFIGSSIDGAKWVELDANNEIQQNNRLNLSSVTLSWDSALISQATFTRSPGLTIYGRFTTASSITAPNHVMIGWELNQTIDPSYTQLVHGFYFNAGSAIVYEKNVAYGSGVAYTTNTSYDCRVRLKATGADYEVKGGIWDRWTTVYNGTGGNFSDSPMRMAITQYNHSGYFDYVYMVKATTTELVTNVYAEQENLAFSNRKQIDINNGGSAQTNYQMRIAVGYNTSTGVDVNLEGVAKTDFSDIRFGDANGVLYNYWLETYSISDKAIFWVKLPSIPAGASSVYIYYGNAIAVSVSNGYSTFDTFFEDFSGSGVNTTRWTELDTKNALRQSGVLNTYNLTQFWDSALISNSTFSRSAGTTLYGRFTTFASVTAPNHVMVGWEVNQTTDPNYTQLVHGLYFNAGSASVYEKGNNYGSGVAYTTNTSYNFRVRLKATGADYEFKTDAVTNWSTVYNGTGGGYTDATMRLAITQHTHTGYFSYLFIPKYAATEPAVSSVGTAEAWGNKVVVWNKGATLRITNSNASVLNNYQVAFTVNTQSLISAGTMNSDGSDIRFSPMFDYDEAIWNVSYPYWIESGLNTSSTKIWVKVDTIPASSTKDIAMYYNAYTVPAASSWTDVFVVNGVYAQELTADANTKGLWHMNNNWNDSSTNANNGSPIAGATFTALSRLGSNAGSFDGTDDYVNVPNAASLQIIGDLTVEFWLYPQNMTIYRLNPVHKDYGYEFSFTLEQNKSMSYYHGQNISTYVGYTPLPSATVQDNQWIHIAVTRDNTNKIVKGYVNGQLVSTSGPYSINPASNTNPVRFAYGYTGFYYKGYMDEVRISSVCLSHTDIMKDAGARKFLTTEPTTSVVSMNTIPYYYKTSGTIISTSINPVKVYQWGTLTFTKTTPSGTTLTVDVLKASDDSTLAANVASGTDLNTIPAVQAETAIKFRANLSASPNIYTPTLSDWTLVYTVDTTAPAPTPNTPVLSNGAAGQISLAWSAATDGQSGLAPYEVERAPDSGGLPGTWGQLATTTNTSYTDSPVNNPSDPMQTNTKYHYRIKAVDNFANEAVGTSSSDITPPAPTPNDPVLTMVSPTRVDLAWASSTDSESGFYRYVIERAPDTGGFAGPFSQIGTSLTNSWSDSSINNPAFPPQANTTYHYRVKTYDNFNNYATGSSSTQCTLADTPVLAEASISYHDRIVVTWQSGGAQQYYKVYRDGVSGTGTLVFNSTPATFSDTVIGGHTYYIYAVNADDAETAGYASAAGQTIPAMNIDPAILQFTAAEGGTDPATQTIGIWNSSTGSFNWNIAVQGTADWLEISPVTGSVSTETDTVSFTASVGALEPGDYSAVVTITADGVTYGTPKDMTVVFNISPKPPAIGVNTNVLTFTAVEYGEDPAPQSIQIWDSSGGSQSLDWQITNAPVWLAVSALSGTSADNTDINTVTLSPGISGFTAANSPYSALLTISASNASNSPQTVAVTVNVTSQAPPEISVAPPELKLSILEGSDGTASLKISNTGGKMLDWVVSDTVSWISLSPYQGSASTESDEVNITLTTSALAATGSPYTADINITDPDAGNSPFTVPVTLVIVPSGANYLNVAAGQYLPPPGNISSASSDVEMLQIRISAVCPDDIMRVNSIALVGGGSGDDAADISAVKLYKDVNDNGTVDTEDIQIGEDGVFAVDNGVIIFNQINETINDGETKTFLVSYTFSGTAQLEKQFTLSLESSTGVNASLVSDSSSAYIIGEYPIDSEAKTVSNEGSIAVEPGPYMPSVRNLARNEPDAGMLQFAIITSDVEDVVVDWIAFASSGTGIETADVKILGVRLIEDADGDGVADADESQIGTRQTFQVDNGSVIFSGLDKTLAKGTTSYWLLTYSFSGTAADKADFYASFVLDSNMYATGVDSGAQIEVVGAPVTGNAVTLTDVILENVEVEGTEEIVQSTGSSSSGASKCFAGRLYAVAGAIFVLAALCLPVIIFLLLKRTNK